jgi:hypothetical protein
MPNHFRLMLGAGSNHVVACPARTSVRTDYGIAREFFEDHIGRVGEPNAEATIVRGGSASR